MTKKGPSIENVTKERLEELLNTNATLKEIALVFNVNPYTVRRWIKYFDIKVIKKPDIAPANMKDKRLFNKSWIKEKLDSGLSRIDISKELGVSLFVVSYWMKKHGFSSDSISEAVKESLKRKYPNGRKGELSSRWKGGRHIKKTGYVDVYCPDHPFAREGRVFEHRLVMEKQLGRFLERNEVIHHKDGNKSNNDIDNLELVSNGKHISNHFKESHEVVELRKQVEDLTKKLALFKNLFS